MTELLLSVLLQGLKLWNSKEANKYLDEVVKLRTEWLEVYSKPRGQRDNEALDMIEMRLELISKAFVEMSVKK